MLGTRSTWLKLGKHHGLGLIWKKVYNLSLTLPKVLLLPKPNTGLQVQS